MEWTQLALYAVVALFTAVFVCWIVNFLLVSKKGDTSPLITRIMYITAIIATVLCAVRNAFAYEEKTILAANIVVLICIIISWVRVERGPAEQDDSDEE